MDTFLDHRVAARTKSLASLVPARLDLWLRSVRHGEIAAFDVVPARGARKKVIGENGDGGESADGGGGVGSDSDLRYCVSGRLRGSMRKWFGVVRLAVGGVFRARDVSGAAV